MKDGRIDIMTSNNNNTTIAPKLVHSGKVYELYVVQSEEGMSNLAGEKLAYRMVNTRTGVAEAEHTLLPAALRLLAVAEEHYLEPGQMELDELKKEPVVFN